MAQLVIEDFRLGQDGRKSKLTLSPGSLVSLKNAHISRGGEVKKRKAFASTYSLPAGETLGMARAGNALYVFGYTGAYATTSFTVTAGSSNPGTNKVSSITVNSVEILNTAVDWVDSHEATATAIAAQINTYTSSPNYTATAAGAVVTISHPDLSATPNGYVVMVGVGGTVTTSSPANLADGVDAPTLPSGVNYLRMQHTTPATALSRVLMTDVFDGKVYSTGEYTDASIHHFYDGARVSDWYDGRARGSFTIAAGSNSSGVKASTQFEVTGGTNSTGINMVTSVVVNGVEVLGANVDWATSNTATATAVAAQITSYTSAPDYTATASGGVVTVFYPTVGSAANGYTASATPAGDVTLTAPPVLSGGIDASKITSVKVDGIEVLSTAVDYSSTAGATAIAVAAQIDTFSSDPEYTASAQGGTVYILAAAAAGTTPNGYEVLVTSTGDVSVSGITNFAGGAASTETFSPGESVRTVDTKMYATSGSLLHFSGVNQPTKYTVDTIGAGFVNMSTSAAGSEDLVGVEVFFGYLAIFAKQAVQIWRVFADDEQNDKVQVLKNTGAIARRSLVAYNDGEVVYLSESGIKSLRARDSTNVATIAEIGDPIDDAVTTQVAALTDTQKEASFSIVEPSDNRLFVVIDDQVYVLSVFSSTKIAAWSVYEPGFSISDAAIIGNTTYFRSGDTIYTLGGTDGTTYGDDYEVVVELPFVAGRSLANFKQFTAIDFACEGVWTVEATFDAKSPDTYTEIGIITGPTYTEFENAISGQSAAIGLRLRHQAAGAATLSSITVHYDEVD